MRKFAALIGTDSCPNDGELLTDVPQVRANINALKKCLKTQNFEVKDYVQKARPNQLVDSIRNEVRSAKETVAIYYVGHGLVRHNELYLCLKNSKCQNIETSGLEFKKLAGVVLDSECKKKMFFLDCCHADLGLTNINSLRQCVSTEGCSSIAAAQAHEAAKVGDRYTYFTRELIDVLTNGSENFDGIDFTIDQVAQEITDRFARKKQFDASYPTVCYASHGPKIRIEFQLKNSGGIETLPISFFERIVKRSIGVQQVHNLSLLFRKNTKLLGVFQAKGIAYSLNRQLEDVNTEINTWRASVSMSLSQLGSPPFYSLARTLQLSASLRAQVLLEDDEKNTWSNYIELAREVCTGLDVFYAFVTRYSNKALALDSAVNLDDGDLDQLVGCFSDGTDEWKKKLVALTSLRKVFVHVVTGMENRLNKWKKRANKIWMGCCEYLDNVKEL